MRDFGPTGDAMRAPGWRTSLVVQGFDLQADRQVPVVVGLINTAAGGVQFALRIGDDRPVILALQDADQLAQNLGETMAERLRVTGERLGGDEP